MGSKRAHLSCPNLSANGVPMRHSFLALALASALGTATPAAVAADHSAELAALNRDYDQLLDSTEAITNITVQYSMRAKMP